MVFLVPALLCFVLAAPLRQNPAQPEQTQPQEQPQEQKADAPDDKPPTPAHTGFRALLHGLKDDITHLPSKQDLRVAGIGGGLALGAHAFDQAVNERVLNPSNFAKVFFGPGKYLGDTPEQMAFSIGTWVLGRAMDKPKMSHLGMDLLRAQALTEIMVQPSAAHQVRDPP